MGIYNLAANTMGLDPAKTVVIEDSEIGNKAAKSAGMKCIVTKSSYTQDENFSGADMIVNQLGEKDDTDFVSFDTIRTVALTEEKVNAKHYTFEMQKIQGIKIYTLRIE